MITSGYRLENEAGERIDLTAPAPMFLVNVEGLGITTKTTYGDLENGFFHVLYDQTPQNNITGDLMYQVTAFENYEMLVNWISKAKALYFCYQPLDTEYRRIVRLNYIVKDRRNGGGWMKAGISFTPLTPWYIAEPTEIGIGGVETKKSKGYFLEGAEYGYRYTADLSYGGDAAGTMSATIIAAGHVPAAVVLRYTGAITNPRIRLVGAETGTVYGICALNTSFSSEETLELSTRYEDSHVTRIKANGEVENVLSAVNQAWEHYFRCPTSEASVLSIESDSAFDGAATLLVYSYYGSV